MHPHILGLGLYVVGMLSINNKHTVGVILMYILLVAIIARVGHQRRMIVVVEETDLVDIRTGHIGRITVKMAILVATLEDQLPLVDVP